MTDEEIREIKSKSLLGTPSAIDVGKLITEINKLKDCLEAQEHLFKLHHDFYKCIPIAAVEEHLESIYSTVAEFLLEAIKVTTRLKGRMIKPLSSDVDSFELLAQFHLNKLRTGYAPWNKVRE
jgi:hypothetical protein